MIKHRLSKKKIDFLKILPWLYPLRSSRDSLKQDIYIKNTKIKQEVSKNVFA